MGDSPYGIIVSPRLRTVTDGAVIRFSITGGTLFMDSQGAHRTYSSIRWFYFHDRDKTWLGTDRIRRPVDSFKSEVSVDFSGLLLGEWTVGAQVRDIDKKEFFPSVKIWVEQASTILASELAAAQKEGLPDLHATMVMTARYKKALQLVAAKNPPSAKQKAQHDATIAHLDKSAQKLADLHAETPGWAAYKLNAVHIEKTTQTKSRLRVLLARKPGSACTWKLIDWTNPLDRTKTGIYERTANTDYEAIDSLLAAWDSGNRYPDGHLKAVKPDQFFRPEHRDWQVATNGSSFWDSVASFFEWIAMGAAVVAGVVTLIAPVPGSRVVSAMIWVSIFSSSTAAVINIAQRKDEGFSNWREDALDGLTIIGNIFAGAGMWARGATVIAKDTSGKIVRYSLIGQVGTDGVQGVLLAEQHVKQYDAIMRNPDLSPKERTDKLLELFRSAAIAGTMTAISMKGTAEDLSNLRKPGLKGETPASRLEKLKDPGAEVDMTGTPKATGDSTKKGGHTTRTQDDHPTPKREDPTHVPPPKGKPKAKTKFPSPPAANSRGMRDLDDKVFGAKAKATGQYVFVRDGNADGVKFIGKSGVDPQGKPFKYEGKPMEMKAKTATEGPYKGVVCFDPTHARTHNTLAKLPGHPELTVDQLLGGKSVKDLMADPNSEFRKRYDYFKKKKIEDSGFKVMDNDHYVVVHAQTNARYHGDYDLHGVYTKDGKFVADTSAMREQINKEMDAKLIQHGAHDEWPDRQNPNVAGENAGPQPPVTVYMPDGSKVWIGGTGSKEKDRVLFKKFFEENGLQWRYADWEALPGNKINTDQ
ncbi:MAG: hypothetical protein KDA05_08380 [Phycisphaerales bacterium]|nr:hypothetical protein [Phycisphaerales bacterium]